LFDVHRKSTQSARYLSRRAAYAGLSRETLIVIRTSREETESQTIRFPGWCVWEGSLSAGPARNSEHRVLREGRMRLKRSFSRLMNPGQRLTIGLPTGNPDHRAHHQWAQMRSTQRDPERTAGRGRPGNGHHRLHLRAALTLQAGFREWHPGEDGWLRNTSQFDRSGSGNNWSERKRVRSTRRRSCNAFRQLRTDQRQSVRTR
jgi:hypothetical protein